MSTRKEREHSAVNSLIMNELNASYKEQSVTVVIRNDLAVGVMTALMGPAATS